MDKKTVEKRQVTQKELARYSELKPLTKEFECLRDHLKANKDNVEAGKLVLAVVVEPGNSTKYAEVVKALKEKHSHLGDEIDELVKKFTSPAPKHTIDVRVKGQ